MSELPLPRPRNDPGTLSVAPGPLSVQKEDGARLFPEDEEDGAAEAEGGPDEIEAEFLAHEDQSERHKDGERNDLLHDLQLGKREGGVTDASENMSRGFLFKSFS